MEAQTVAATERRINPIYSFAVALCWSRISAYIRSISLRKALAACGRFSLSLGELACYRGKEREIDRKEGGGGETLTLASADRYRR